MRRERHIHGSRRNLPASSLTMARRIFLAGATGVLGMRLVPLLLANGHTVAGMTRSPQKADLLQGLGAEPVVCDVYDRTALDDAVLGFRPDVVIDELTDLPDDMSLVSTYVAANARMRRVGGRNLLAATLTAGLSRILAQSVAWELAGDGGAAVAEHERAVLEAGGVVLRYGRFYGPGTYFEQEPPPAPRIHIDEAARRTVSALDARAGVVALVEDEVGRDWRRLDYREGMA
jgi:nucleoside-diphosphate-sugar epimerase